MTNPQPKLPTVTFGGAHALLPLTDFLSKAKKIKAITPNASIYPFGSAETKANFSIRMMVVTILCEQNNSHDTPTNGMGTLEVSSPNQVAQHISMDEAKANSKIKAVLHKYYMGLPPTSQFTIPNAAQPMIVPAPGQGTFLESTNNWEWFVQQLYDQRHPNVPIDAQIEEYVEKRKQWHAIFFIAMASRGNMTESKAEKLVTNLRPHISVPANIQHLAAMVWKVMERHFSVQLVKDLYEICKAMFPVEFLHLKLQLDRMAGSGFTTARVTYETLKSIPYTTSMQGLIDNGEVLNLAKAYSDMIKNEYAFFDPSYKNVPASSYGKLVALAYRYQKEVLLNKNIKGQMNMAKYGKEYGGQFEELIESLIKVRSLSGKINPNDLIGTQRFVGDLVKLHIVVPGVPKSKKRSRSGGHGSSSSGSDDEDDDDGDDNASSASRGVEQPGGVNLAAQPPHGQQGGSGRQQEQSQKSGAQKDLKRAAPLTTQITEKNKEKKQYVIKGTKKRRVSIPQRRLGDKYLSPSSYKGTRAGDDQYDFSQLNPAVKGRADEAFLKNEVTDDLVALLLKQDLSSAYLQAMLNENPRLLSMREYEDKDGVTHRIPLRQYVNDILDEEQAKQLEIGSDNSRMELEDTTDRD